MPAMHNLNPEDFKRFRTDPDAPYNQKNDGYIHSSPKIIFLPCNLQFVRNGRGYFSLGFIIFTWAYNTYIVPKIILLPQYNDGNVGILSLLCYYAISMLTFVSLFRAATGDPGRLPFDLKATTLDQLNWTHCQRCLIQRPLKSHHCSKCQRCVRKMDHHCHWINNCVAEDNQWLFLLLVFYATVLSIYTLILDTLHFYYFPECETCQSPSFILSNQRYFMYLSFVLGILLTWLAGSQVLWQTANILSSRSTIESIIESHKPICERSPPAPWMPYQRFLDVCGPGWMLCWLNPFRQRLIKPEIFYYQQTV